MTKAATTDVLRMEILGKVLRRKLLYVTCIAFSAVLHCVANLVHTHMNSVSRMPLAWGTSHAVWDMTNAVWGLKHTIEILLKCY